MAGCDWLVFREREGANKSFFSEVTSSISDVKYSSNGRFIIARDYLHIKIWDTHMDCMDYLLHKPNMLSRACQDLQCA